MELTVRFKLDVKKNAYVAKKNVGKEPTYQICAIIRLNRKNEINYFTGYRAEKGAWFKDATEAKSGDKRRGYGIHKGCYAYKKHNMVNYSEVNKTLDLISGKVSELSIVREDISKDELIEILDKMTGKYNEDENKDNADKDATNSEQPVSLWHYADLYCHNINASDGRRKTLSNAMQHFKSFECHRRKNITFEGCNAKLLTDFQLYLQQDEGQNTTNNAHKTRKKNINTISKIMAATKYFFKWCRIQYGINSYGNIDDYKVPTQKYGDPITITQEEKRHLYDLKFEEKDSVLEWTRDLFFFQCSVGMRVSDFFALKYGNLSTETNGLAIRYCPKKTKDITAIECRVPLTPNAQKILDKYRIPNATSTTPLFPFPKHPQTYNDNLKRLFKIAGLTRTVMVSNAYGEVEYKPLYELAKSKFGRSNFIDTMVGLNQSTAIIATMSGHSAGSKAFHRYHNSQKEAQQVAAVALLD